MAKVDKAHLFFALLLLLRLAVAITRPPGVEPGNPADRAGPQAAEVPHGPEGSTVRLHSALYQVCQLKSFFFLINFNTLASW